MLATVHIGNGVIEFPPAIVNHVAYVAQDSGFIRAVRLVDSSTIWKIRLAKAADSPVVSHGRVFVDTSAGLTAVSAGTGRKVWRRSVAAGESKPLVIGTHVCVGARVGGVFCFGQYGGSMVRHIADSCKITGAVRASNGSLFWDDYCGEVYRAGPHRLIWTAHAGRVFYGAPAVYDGRVYVGDRDTGSYSALDAATGAVVWRTHVGYDVYGSPVVTKGAVYGTYRGSSGGGFVKLNRATGALLWRRAESVPVMCTPVVTGSRVWFATAPANYAAGTVTAFNVNGMKPVLAIHDGRYTPEVSDGSTAVVVGRDTLYELPGAAR